MEFEPHGSFTLYVEDNILFVDATGPFNEEIALLYLSQYRDIMLKFQPKAQISILRGSCVFNREIEEHLRKLHEWNFERGLNIEAMVLDTDKSEHLLFKKQLERTRINTNAPYRLFDTQDEALDWVRSKLG